LEPGRPGPFEERSGKTNVLFPETEGKNQISRKVGCNQLKLIRISRVGKIFNCWGKKRKNTGRNLPSSFRIKKRSKVSL